MDPPPNDPLARILADRRQRLNLFLAADGCPDLLPLLDAAAGATVAGAYRIDGLMAVGRQFLVWLAIDLGAGRPTILKQTRFDYRHPVRYGHADAARRRATIRREYDVLMADRTGTLPRPLALMVCDSPVPAAAAAPALARNEVFVAEEYIRGLTVTELALRVFPTRPPADREAALARLTARFIAFWEGLRAGGWHYGDLSADNLLTEADRLRVVDGGSAVPAADAVVLPGFTPAFTTPNLYAALSAGRPVPGSLASILPAFGKVLHFALTGREPFNGHTPDLGLPALEPYSPRCRLVLDLFLRLDDDPTTFPQARRAALDWAARSG